MVLGVSLIERSPPKLILGDLIMNVGLLSHESCQHAKKLSSSLGELSVVQVLLAHLDGMVEIWVDDLWKRGCKGMELAITHVYWH